MTKSKKEIKLPFGVVVIGLSLDEVAVYVGVSPTIFLRMVKDGRMPQPKRIDARRVWDRREVDEAFSHLGSSSESVPSPAAADIHQWLDPKP